MMDKAQIHSRSFKRDCIENSVNATKTITNMPNDPKTN